MLSQATDRAALRLEALDELAALYDAAGYDSELGQAILAECDRRDRAATAAARTWTREEIGLDALDALLSLSDSVRRDPELAAATSPKPARPAPPRPPQPAPPSTVYAAVAATLGGIDKLGTWPDLDAAKQACQRHPLARGQALQWRTDPTRPGVIVARPAGWRRAPQRISFAIAPGQA
jgi:hypothetical protein